MITDSLMDWATRAATVTIVAPITALLQDMVFTVGFAVALTVTLLAERFIPADDRQPVFSVGFCQDMVWFVYETILHAVVIMTYVNLLTGLFHRHLSVLHIEAVAEWSPWARFVIGFMMLDFLYWLQHYINHKVPLLWRFHALHHSQTQLNFFSDFRYHVVEYLIRHTILTIPFLLLSVPIPTVVLLSVVLRYYSRFYHGNVRTNLGPLRFVLVTPQSHRVHHSVLTRHHDTNYGSILSIWDRMFGTHYHGEDEYPATGITDENFPREASVRIGALLLTPLRQLGYPLRQTIRARLRARRLRAERTKREEERGDRRAA